MNIVDNAPHFTGFPKDFTNLLFSLQFNNTIELLPENKLAYKPLISEPLTLLFNGLTQTALSVSDTLITKPSKCVSTMYSDMRFSRATPLKGYMYIRFREPSSEKDILGLYFDMGCDYYGYGIRIYKQTSAGMERIRGKIIENSQSFMRELDKLDRLNMAIIGDKFAKDHYPEINNEALKNLLNRKSFYIERACPINESVYNGKLQDEIIDAYQKLKGLYLLLRKSLYGN
ncbi:DUF2461 family protein [Ruminiclostridium cellobioparum]|uniref:TIGR02453 family protein n=1 Tax=Ruminiclostridium cellobioparum subsp. termitidis CT1112 TaxID=1195236 RepID=S0FG15_RUMCE|nr:DUF2461 family protein [Ruminiclostridium cellobioparum]EMS69757.1 hypothetical protein CTER_4714 [Ruminiclostridium cellobioparum subsp. termitidis CT1112]